MRERARAAALRFDSEGLGAAPTSAPTAPSPAPPATRPWGPCRGNWRRLQVAAEDAMDERPRGVRPAVEVDRRHERLERLREDRPVLPPLPQLPAAEGGRRPPEPLRGPPERGPVHDVLPPLREDLLVRLREVRVERVRNQEAEERVPEEREPVVRREADLRVLLRVRGVRERPLEEAGVVEPVAEGAPD